MEFIGSLCLILISTAIGGHFSARLNLPAVIGELLVGILLGPALLNWLQPNDFIHFFSEIGVVILMFIAGLESDLSLLRRFIRPSTYVAVVGMLFPILIAYLTGLYFHFSQLESIFLGVTFAATSVSISVVVLQEMKQLDSHEGTTILGAAVVDDVLAVIVLSILISFSGGQVNSSGNKQNLVLSLLLQIGYFVLLFVLGRWVIPYVMQFSSKLLVPASETLISLVLCLGLADLADITGLSTVIGAFFAGLAIGQTDYKVLIDRNIEPIGYAVFIPVFFVSIGLNMTFTGIINDFWLFFVLSIGGILSKLLGAGLGAKLAHFSWPSSFMIGAGMVSRGEMALIIAQLGIQSHLLSTDRYSAVIGAIIITTLITPFLLRGTISKINH
ncbi:cation:proton antiporter [Ligilactobacillus acidipiscis]|uniref:Na(+) H(+) antiporter n=1 Tax=Ligilactobacillus acidipiscis TaxID=89059 RepID=A0A0R2JYY9_9LACO|nr:cation:proton antiporter [Ligilactobacillus acidipiscis]KRN79706.1 Na(+) H(+) antiporter [Ligilactobacillus acidipiscis]